MSSVRQLLASAWTAGIVAALWLGFLVWLTATTANPTTVNWQQLVQADQVIVGRVVDAGTGLIAQTGDWPLPQGAGETLSVTNLDRAGARTGKEYVLPLTREFRREEPPVRWTVTASRLPGAVPLIYPADESVIEQVRKIRPLRRTAQPAASQEVTAPAEPRSG